MSITVNIYYTGANGAAVCGRDGVRRDGGGYPGEGGESAL